MQFWVCILLEANYLGETTGSIALNRIYNRMAKDPIGRQILAEKPRVNTKTINVDFLRKLPEKTFGGAYIRFAIKYY